MGHSGALRDARWEGPDPWPPMQENNSSQDVPR